MKSLRTLGEIRAAGAALVEDWPPLTDREIERIAFLLAPCLPVRATAAGDTMRTDSARIAGPSATSDDRGDDVEDGVDARDDELAALRLYSPKQAAAILSGDTPGAVTAWFLAQGCRDGRFPCTMMGRRRMFSRADIADIIAISRVEPTALRHPRRAR